MDDFAVIVVAGGIGKRFGSQVPKQLVEIFNKPLFIYSLEPFLELGFSRVFLTYPKNYIKIFEKYVRKFGINEKVILIEGGRERYESVYNALADQRVQGSKFVLIHDGVRPLVDKSLIKRVVSTATEKGSAIPAIPVKDTIKKVDEFGYVSETLNRSKIFAVQTPQCFLTQTLFNAYNFVFENGLNITDDAMAVELIGEKVFVVEGDFANIKVTTKFDLYFVKFILSNRFGF